MGSRLRKLKALWGEKLSDVKTIGGKGHQTDAIISKLTTFYGNAIRANSHNVNEMMKAVWAVWAHTSNIDNEPKHWFCPKGKNNWSRISKAKRRKRVTRDMSTLKNSMLELAAKFDDNYNTGLIKSFMFGLNKTEIKTMTDILSRYKFRDSHVNGDRYRAMITNFFIPELINHDVQELWFQQDGATCHTARATIDFIERHVWCPPNFTFWTCELTSKIL
ncbi:uncharacterized protein TNCV_1343231 [Trichonephila clavipes]|nr:uncharacterized protein TNCV_1343231 [Trichonephila clavipes]